MNKALLIVGMHRSGTSALAGALSILGVDEGTDLLPAKNGENEKGFFELREVHVLHERLLLSGGRTWDTPSPLTSSWLDRFATSSFKAELVEILKRNFTNSELWTVKDPRLCQLLPLWKEVLADLAVDVAVIHIVREPDAVAASLARRNGFSAQKSGYLWLDHNLSAEHDSRGLQRAYLSYEDLLDGKMAALKKLSDQLGLSWPRSSTSTAAAIESFLTADLDHRRDPFPEGSGEYGRLTELITEVATLLPNLSGLQSQDTLVAFDGLREQRNALLSDIDSILLTHCTDLVLGSGGLQDLQDSVNAAERALETAAAHVRKTEVALQTAEKRERQSKKHLTSLEKSLNAQRDEVEKVDSYARILESDLKEKGNLTRELEDEIHRQADSIAEHEQARQEAVQYTRSLEREIDKQQRHLDELDHYSRSLERENDKRQKHQNELNRYSRSLERENENHRELEAEMVGHQDSLAQYIGKLEKELQDRQVVIDEGAAHVRGLEAKVTELEIKSKAMIEREADLETRLDEMRGRLVEREAAIESRDAELDRIHRSLPWRLFSVFRKTSAES